MDSVDSLLFDSAGCCEGLVALHGLRTEGWAVRRKLAPLDASTTGENLDESIFTRVTKCHKKHAFTRSRPRSHSRRRASDFTRALIARARLSHARAPPVKQISHAILSAQAQFSGFFQLFLEHYYCFSGYLKVFSGSPNWARAPTAVSRQAGGRGSEQMPVRATILSLLGI